MEPEGSWLSGKSVRIRGQSSTGRSRSSTTTDKSGRWTYGKKSDESIKIQHTFSKVHTDAKTAGSSQRKIKFFEVQSALREVDFLKYVCTYLPEDSGIEKPTKVFDAYELLESGKLPNTCTIAILGDLLSSKQQQFFDNPNLIKCFLSCDQELVLATLFEASYDTSGIKCSSKAVEVLVNSTLTYLSENTPQEAFEIKFVFFLMQHKRKIPADELKEIINKNSYLHLMLKLEDFISTKLLIEMGADVNLEDQKQRMDNEREGLVPLEIALNSESFTVLLENGANLMKALNKQILDVTSDKNRFIYILIQSSFVDKKVHRHVNRESLNTLKNTVTEQRDLWKKSNASQKRQARKKLKEMLKAIKNLYSQASV